MDLTDPRKKAIENNHRRKFPYLSEKVSWKHQFEQIFKIHRNSNIFTLPGIFWEIIIIMDLSTFKYYNSHP